MTAGLPKKIILFFAGLCLAMPVFAQQNMGPVRVYQLSGLVVSKTSKEPVPFATIQVNRSRRGMLTNRDGFYSLPVVETDTLWITCLGFKKTSFPVADYLKDYEGEEGGPYVYAIHYLPEDTIQLDTVVIHPFDTPEKLRTALLAMDPNTDPQAGYARDNLDPRVLTAFIKNMDADEGERLLVGREMYYQKQQTALKAPVLPLFDPIAAYQLLRYINEKSKKKKEKDLNYWKEN